MFQLFEISESPEGNENPSEPDVNNSNEKLNSDDEIWTKYDNESEPDPWGGSQYSSDAADSEYFPHSSAESDSDEHAHHMREISEDESSNYETAISDSETEPDEVLHMQFDEYLHSMSIDDGGNVTADLKPHYVRAP
ncbi:hypothetical protein L218DRAFT_1007295 [Marasmius fiardii PR-910]|nr:hypothetical protein L218DRAFT_1007295 [Marasmius fiardii PR-910]